MSYNDPFDPYAEQHRNDPYAPENQYHPAGPNNPYGNPYDNPYGNPPGNPYNSNTGFTHEIPHVTETDSRSWIPICIGVVGFLTSIFAFYFATRVIALPVAQLSEKDGMVWIFRILFVVSLILVMIVLPATASILFGQENADQRRRCTVFTHGRLYGYKETRHRRRNSGSFNRYYYTYNPKYLVEVNGRREIRTMDISKGTPNFIKEADFLVDPLGGDIIYASEYSKQNGKNGLGYCIVIWGIVLSLFVIGAVSVYQSSHRSSSKQKSSDYSYSSFLYEQSKDSV